MVLWAFCPGDSTLPPQDGWRMPWTESPGFLKLTHVWNENSYEPRQCVPSLIPPWSSLGYAPWSPVPPPPPNFGTKGGSPFSVKGNGPMNPVYIPSPNRGCRIIPGKGPGHVEPLGDESPEFVKRRDGYGNSLTPSKGKGRDSKGSRDNKGKGRQREEVSRHAQNKGQGRERVDRLPRRSTWARSEPYPQDRSRHNLNVNK